MSITKNRINIKGMRKKPIKFLSISLIYLISITAILVSGILALSAVASLW